LNAPQDEGGRVRFSEFVVLIIGIEFAIEELFDELKFIEILVVG